VEEGLRGSRHSHVEKLLVNLTGAEGALVVNNNAAAVLLSLSALFKDKEVIVSRGELIEIGGAFRIPDIMMQSGCALKEVGTTNRTRLSDFENAINERTGALLKAHTSNFKIVGFTEEVALKDMVGLGRQHNLPVIYDLGRGSLLPLEPFGICDEPDVISCVKAGADILTFSGDKLLGGPQAGIIVGKKELIEKIKKHPLARALRIDKLTLAALEATLRLYLDPEKAKAEIPALKMLSAKQSDLHEKAGCLYTALSPIKDQIRVVEAQAQVGGGSVPSQMLPSVALEVLPRDMKVTELEQHLRHSETPIIARIAHDCLLIDMRTVEEGDFPYLANCLIRVLGENA
jgi:L-seryl-tRNA(Ser) seleniumtransferase